MKLSSGILRILPVLCFAASVAGHPHRSARQASFLSTLINSLLRPSGDNAVGEDTAELGRLAGYAVETHTVITNDGYVLTIHHIPPNAKQKFNHETARLNSTMSNNVRSESSLLDESYLSSKPNPAKVVFLQHGLMGSSDNWNTNTKEDCLAYLLSDDGYDVWMGNIRGNIYSRKHKNLTLEDPLFWKFSFDEMAKYDLPAMLDYVLEKTGVEKLHYVGHSMGTTVFFALMSSQPEYQQRIASMVALAPVATVTSISSPIKYLAPVVNDLQFFLRFFGNDEELMTNPLLISLWDPYKACSNQALCENLQFMITGFDPSRADQTMVPIILTHNPAGSSTQTLFHFAQGFSSGEFIFWEKKLVNGIFRFSLAF
ncbi:lipase member K-like [Palaemon carinicauda]|uniref:lipase member K-like n=1 Tax=Palaemon carinicauda TaxID=392227 RepID=UPI0035B633F9